MSFQMRDGVLHVEGVPLPVIADAAGTPAYVYAATALHDAARSFVDALAPIARKQLLYAVKANPHPAILPTLAGFGFGADIVSGGELQAAQAGGIAPADIVYSGLGKTREEMGAVLDAGIGRFNIEHAREGEVLSALACARGMRATALLRVNPLVDAQTHAKISTALTDSKFGIPYPEAIGMYHRLAALPGLNLQGLAVHIGSQITDLSPLQAAYRRAGTLVAALRTDGHCITHADLGGGLGVSYRAGAPGADVAACGAMVARETEGWDVTLLFEPGRFLVAQAGVLLTRVLWVKPGQPHPFVIVDAAMNDLARPALYDAWHEFIAVRPRDREHFAAHVVGPVCESGDSFAHPRAIDRVEEGDLAVLATAGAYGAAMASTYNARALVSELWVDGDRFDVGSDRMPAALARPQRVPRWMAVSGQRAAVGR
ncbi:diaminopimelate decarboxylase [Sphingomonas sp. ABOLD]|uniref:Diaminopimelate decarboxylase n=1 Tax=Sphingomonas trueperi TaxID=53317 RepID=A0A7X6BC76_9SPHN|nr:MULTISPECIES: diaminopimelate decarboxylase [Sphingomonas]NJB96616.1 diaminopimelate decarboxylase [Sphingomonas trueperi]RSV46703.1 diaminopimelate decarboxylase [Sphingomonas sp. ABOLD]